MATTATNLNASTQVQTEKKSVKCASCESEFGFFWRRFACDGKECSGELCTDCRETYPLAHKKHLPENWGKDIEVSKCTTEDCTETFGVFTRRHHCRQCGLIFCSKHAQTRSFGARTCDSCSEKAAECDLSFMENGSGFPTKDELGKFCRSCFEKESTLDFNTFWEVCGPEEGRPLLMLHGEGCSRAMMRPQAEALALQGFRVFLMDLPGHGTLVDEKLDLASVTARVMELVQEQATKPCLLIGASLGAFISMELVAHYPGMFTGAIFVDCGNGNGGFGSLDFKKLAGYSNLKLMQWLSKEVSGDGYRTNPARLMETIFQAGLFTQQSESMQNLSYSLLVEKLLPLSQKPVLFCTNEKNQGVTASWAKSCPGESEVIAFPVEQFLLVDDRAMSKLVTDWVAFAEKLDFEQLLDVTPDSSMAQPVAEEESEKNLVGEDEGDAVDVEQEQETSVAPVPAPEQKQESPGDAVDVEQAKEVPVEAQAEVKQEEVTEAEAAAEQEETPASPEQEEEAPAPEQEEETPAAPEQEEEMPAAPEQEEEAPAPEQDETPAVPAQEEETPAAEQEEETPAAPVQEEEAPAPAQEEETPVPEQEEETPASAQEETPAPEQEEETPAPEQEEETPAAPEQEEETPAPEQDETPAAPEQEEETPAPEQTPETKPEAEIVTSEQPETPAEVKVTEVAPVVQEEVPVETKAKGWDRVKKANKRRRNKKKGASKKGKK